MKNIKPFIDLGWYTVPLKGKLERLSNGKKTTPIYEKDWKALYHSTFNENATDIGLVITGSISDIIAIDCDNQAAFDIFKSLEDKDYGWIFESVGKPSGGGTIIYKYVEGLDTFAIQNKNIKLDFYADQGAIYLPTSANKTKQPMEAESFRDLPEIKELPPAAFALLKNLQEQYILGKGNKDVTSVMESVKVCANYLCPQLETFIKDKDFSPSLFRMLTPKSFRSLPQYVQRGYLHPDKVPDGRGSEYLSKISAILGSDPSVDKAMFREVIHLINNMWAQPMNASRLDNTVINRMLSGDACIDGDQIWAYDEDWKTKGLTFSTKIGESVELFFDDIRCMYYLVNYTRLSVQAFYRDGDLVSYVEAISSISWGKKKLKTRLPIVRTCIDPALQFGFYKKDEYTREFNLFKQTANLAIINEPEAYKQFYSYPTNLMNFLETLIPDVYMRNYLLGFIKRKLISFKYSPVIPYFLGVSGSGKDTFVTILSEIIGDQYVAKPTAKEFIEQYNGYLIDKYFVQLDEYGNQLATNISKQEALGKIKTYTGKDNIQIRQMRTDGFNYKHSMTFIITANTNPLMLEENDRRIALFETPNILAQADWVMESGGISVVYEKIMGEIKDFCYYLSTEVQAVSWDEYMTPPETKMKMDLIASVMPAAQRIAFLCSRNMFDDLKDLCEEYNCIDVFKNAQYGRIFEEDLFELYVLMTDNRGTKNGLTKYMKQANFEKIPTTRNFEKAYYYHVPYLAAYETTNTIKDYSKEGDFK